MQTGRGAVVVSERCVSAATQRVPVQEVPRATGRDASAWQRAGTRDANVALSKVIGVKTSEGSILRIALSDSFGLAIEQLVGELNSPLVEGSNRGDGVTSVAPPNAIAILIQAGGSEAAATDLLLELAGSSAPRYVLGAAADHRLAAACIQKGARDYFALPDDLDLLRRTLERDVRAARGRVAADRFADEEKRDSGFGAILGRSAVLQQTLSQAARVAALGNVTVLIGGETGTGKELLARAIHYEGPRAAAPFVDINCAAIPAQLLESELFGHVKGAFTGAVSTKPGLFELADGGTIFLDEVGHLPLELQPKLLRVLESKVLRRVGAQTTKLVDVRVIGATHVDLAAAVQRGEFREDLYYRLNVVALTLPPLRLREDDVELLAQRFVELLATSYGLPLPVITAPARTRLRLHAWPGNVRELRNVIERALVLSPPGTLQLGDLQSPPGQLAVPAGPIPFPADLATVVRATALAMVALTRGNKSEAARRLGISRSRLQRLLDGLPDDSR
ncbi:MAG: sigma-54 interaction domain-containing protein [Gemmatimonadaceae bacterium]